MSDRPPARLLVSACLLGEPVRYDGRGAPISDARLRTWAAAGRLVAFCPEVAAGLPVPRSPAEIRGPSGASVLAGQGSVIEARGGDLTARFIHGARLALRAARANDCRVALLKDGSPSCGVNQIYDGSFGRRVRAGQGVCAALLARAGVALFAETDLDRAAACLQALEGGGSPGEKIR